MEIPIIIIDSDDDSTDIEEDERTSKIQLKFSLLKESFPDADLDYLRDKSREFANDDIGFNGFLDQMLENDYPKIEKNMPVVVVEKNIQFDAAKFVRKYRDPIKFFTEQPNASEYFERSFQYLLARYRLIKISVIREALEKNEDRLYPTYKELEGTPPSRVKPRNHHEINLVLGIPPKLFNDELDLINYEGEVKQALLLRNVAVEEARKKQTLFSCSICMEDDILQNEVVNCSEGHGFCENCVNESTNIQVGEGKTVFSCLQQCTGSFSLYSLKGIIPDDLYNILSKKIQADEIAAANIPGLETCPSCSYSAIPPETSSIFNCDNCGTQTCRLCHRKEHIPFKCNEARDEETEQRIIVEEAMTSAFLRKCLECGREFVRTDGCNYVTCTCSAKMCYICRRPVQQYSHFFFNFHLQDRASDGSCPLWTSSGDDAVLVERARNRAIINLKRRFPDLDVDMFAKKRK